MPQYDTSPSQETPPQTQTQADPPGEQAPRPDSRPNETNGQAPTRRPKKWRRNGNRNNTRRTTSAQPQTTKAEELTGEPIFTDGILEMSPKGFGFIREKKNDYDRTPEDVFLTPEIIRRNALRVGMWIEGEARQGSRGPQMTKVLKVDNQSPDIAQTLPAFEELRAVNPNKRLVLETDSDRFTTRVIDLMTPIGRGQRGLIVAPPRTGKTTLLHDIATAVTKNYPEMKLIVMLIDERPEEVTMFSREFTNAEIYASSNDSPVASHTRIAELGIERAKRLVERGEHVFVIMDSITRLGRAFNNATKGGGRTMSGGVDIRALEIPRRLFAAARNTRTAGSLTIIATALIETGSRMDDLIFQEFKGTGNMELVLDRIVAQNFIYPAVDIFKSGTRREELLLAGHMLEKIRLIRRGLAGHKPIEAIERLLYFMKKFHPNTQLLLEIKN